MPQKLNFFTYLLDITFLLLFGIFLLFLFCFLILGKGVVQLICLVLLDRVLAARLPVILCHLAVPALFVAKY